MSERRTPQRVQGFPPIDEHRKALAFHLTKVMKVNWNPDTFEYRSAWSLIHLVDLSPPELGRVLPFEQRTSEAELDRARVKVAEWDLERARAESGLGDWPAWERPYVRAAPEEYPRTSPRGYLRPPGRSDMQIGVKKLPLDNAPLRIELDWWRAFTKDMEDEARRDWQGRLPRWRRWLFPLGPRRSVRRKLYLRKGGTWDPGGLRFVLPETGRSW